MICLCAISRAWNLSRVFTSSSHWFTASRTLTRNWPLWLLWFKLYNTTENLASPSSNQIDYNPSWVFDFPGSKYRKLSRHWRSTSGRPRELQHSMASLWRRRPRGSRDCRQSLPWLPSTGGRIVPCVRVKRPVRGVCGTNLWRREEV